MRMRFLLSAAFIVAVLVGTFAPVAPSASAQQLQLAFPCPTFGGGPTNPVFAQVQVGWSWQTFLQHVACRYVGGVANEVVPTTPIAYNVRYRVPGVWPEIMATAGPGQSIRTDWAEFSPVSYLSAPASQQPSGCPVFGGVQTVQYWTGTETVCKRWSQGYTSSDSVPWGWRADVWLPNEGRTLWNQPGGTWISGFDEATLRH